ncbi:hypothetical protein [Streptomyces sp. NPDC058872]|uniref:hypothetical protein n=1 Tax=Streptomyces sp. NPDC058872 TaxID=3346661 RepID=UPI0036B4188C
MKQTTHMGGKAVRSLSAALSVTALLGAAACGADEESGPPPSASRSPSATGSAPAATPDTSGVEAAKSVLEGAFVGMEPLGGGAGQVQRQFGNMHPAMPDDVLSVTFAFTCTGGTTVALRFTVAGEEVPSAAGTQVCDGSVFQRILDASRPGPLDFSIAATGPEKGFYAYAYYPEKKRLP